MISLGFLHKNCRQFPQNFRLNKKKMIFQFKQFVQFSKNSLIFSQCTWNNGKSRKVKKSTLWIIYVGIHLESEILAIFYHFFFVCLQGLLHFDLFYSPRGVACNSAENNGFNEFNDVLDKMVEHLKYRSSSSHLFSI